MKSQITHGVLVFIFCLLLITPTVVCAGELAGHKFLITSVRTGDTEIFLVDPDMGDVVNLTRSPKSEERYACWLTDGKHIVFTSNRDGTCNLYVMNADGSNVRQLTHARGATITYLYAQLVG